MKNSYILLRNNSESASLSIEDLQQIGLKPTDLIWVECQSVYWRSPMEISELKALVSADNNRDKNDSGTETIENSTQPPELPNQKNIEIKTAFEELPALTDPIKKKNPMTANSDSFLTDMEKYGDPDKSINIAPDKKVIDFKTNYSRPLDEIKEMYVKNMVKKEQKRKSIIEIRVPEKVKKIALYTGLVLAGALIMLFFKSIEGKTPSVVQVPDKQPVKIISATDTQSSEVENNNTSKTESYEQKNFPTDKITDAPPVEQKQSAIITRNIPLNKPEKKNETQDLKNEKIEKNTKSVYEIKTVKSETAENISSKLALKANDYKVGSFGGIRNLELTLRNDSKYLLDKVTVVINYLNPEGIILKTDNIYFQSIQPGDMETIPVNKTKRGVKVDYKIIKIESKELASYNSKTAESNNYSSN